VEIYFVHQHNVPGLVAWAFGGPRANTTCLGPGLQRDPRASTRRARYRDVQDCRVGQTRHLCSYHSGFGLGRCTAGHILKAPDTVTSHGADPSLAKIWTTSGS